MTKPEVVHHNKEAHDVVENLIEANWKAHETFGGEFNEDNFVTEDMWFAYLNYWPTDPVELAELEYTSRLFDDYLAKKMAEKALAAVA
jgi:hypothetical protein